MIGKQQNKWPKNILEFDKSELCYEKVGSGPLIWLAFHGFAQNKAYFERMVAPLSDTHTFYCFDLFFHKESKWHKGTRRLTKDIWRGIMEKFMKEESIETFSVTGFSLGGRFAMVTLELFPDRVRSITLLAPDGIKTNPWYNLGTKDWMHPIFNGILNRPTPFLALNRIAHSAGIIRKSVYEFNKLQLNERHRRKRVYLTWIVFKPIFPDLSSIAHILNERQIPIKFLIGEFDTIIHLGSIEPLRKKVPHTKIIMLPVGHYKLMNKVDEPTLRELYY